MLFSYANLFFLAAAVFFLVKWQAARRQKQTSLPGGSEELDRVFHALRRLENKLDLLTGSRGTIAPAIVPESRPMPAPPESVPVPDAPAPRPAAPPEASASPAPAPAVPGPDLPPVPSPVSAPITAPIPAPITVPSGELDPDSLEARTRAILARIWSWVLVGEEFRPKGVPLEFAVAGTWLMRLGVVALVSCVVWFLKWSMDHGLLAPGGRVGLSFAAGAALLGSGYRMAGKRYQVMGQGFMGGGLAALYFAAYACGPLYHLLPTLACFAVMALITLGGCLVAAFSRSQLTAILAMLGGYATPVLLSTGAKNYPGLYAYMFLLGGGVLGLALYRNWRLLHYLAFAAHWSLVVGSLRDYRSGEDFPVVLPFLLLFFLQQHGVTMGHAFRRAQAITWLEAFQQFVLTGLFAGLGYHLIQEAAGKPWPALLAIGLGALFAGQTLLVLKRMPFDRLSTSVSLALAGFFTAWSVPLLLGGASLAAAWSLMALAWLWAGLRMGSQLLVLGSHALFLLAGLRIATHDFLQAYAGAAQETQWLEYLRGLSRRFLNFGVYIASLFLAARLYLGQDGISRDGRRGPRLTPQADVPFATSLPMARTLAFLLGFSGLCFVAHHEMGRMLGFYPILRSPGIILVWIALAAWLALAARDGSGRKGIAILPKAAALFLVLVCVRVIAVDWRDMGFSVLTWRFEDAGLQMVLRMAGHAALLLLLWRTASAPAIQPLARHFVRVAVGLLFLMTTLEIRTVFGAFLPQFQAGALSVAWALFAMGLVGLGLKFRNRAGRFAGLVLFALVAAKIFLLDLASLDMMWRVLSFMAVGAILLLGSFAYLRASRPDAEPEPAIREKEAA